MFYDYMFYIVFDFMMAVIIVGRRIEGDANNRLFFQTSEK